jgi:chromosome segregation ATPase
VELLKSQHQKLSLEVPKLEKRKVLLEDELRVMTGNLFNTQQAAEAGRRKLKQDTEAFKEYMQVSEDELHDKWVELEAELTTIQSTLQARDEELALAERRLEEREASLVAWEDEIKVVQDQLVADGKVLADRATQLQKSAEALDKIGQDLNLRKDNLDQKQVDLDAALKSIAPTVEETDKLHRIAATWHADALTTLHDAERKKATQDDRESLLTTREARLSKREADLSNKEKKLEERQKVLTRNLKELSSI